MHDFKEFEPSNELQTDSLNISNEEAIREISYANELNEEDASWIEKIFQRITEPLTDLFDNSKPGYDTEHIIPSANSDVTDEELMEYNVTEATAEWHVQKGDNSCAVCSQQFIINEFLNLDITEDQLCAIAEANGWLDEQGTSPQDVDNLLELFGIDSHINYEGSIDDLKNTLDEGGRAIVAVDSMVLWIDGVGNYPIYGADHAIEVVGFDESDPNNIKVIINDSGTEDGCGKSVPLDEFMEAWIPSGGFIVSAYPKN